LKRKDKIIKQPAICRK